MRCETRPKRSREFISVGSPEQRKASHVISQLYQAVTSEQRLAVTRRLLGQLQSSCSFNHPKSNIIFSDSLLQAGIVNTLCVHLGFVNNYKQYPESCKDATPRTCPAEEIDTISCVLNAIYRSCTEKAREESLLGHRNDLFHLLTKGLTLGVPPTSILATFHACSGSRNGTALLFQSGVISSIARIFQRKIIVDDNSLLEAMGILKNLSYYGEESRLEMAEHGTLTLHLAEIPFSHRETTTTASNNPEKDKVLERLSAIFRNLAVSPSPRPVLARCPQILNAIARMGSHSSRQIQRNILNFLLNVGQDVDSCIILCLHGDGILVNLLKRFMRNDADAAIRKRAVRILRMLACEGSATLLVHDSTLIACLLERALHDTSHEVCAEATDAIARLAAFIKAPMVQHNQILDALAHLASRSTTQPEVLALALMQQASEPKNRSPMTERGILLESLAQLALSTDTTNQAKEHACCAILDLTKQEMSRARLATCSILEALTQNSTISNRNDHQDDQRRVFGIKALVNLAKVGPNRKAMANHNLLLQTLVLFAASSRDHEVKSDVKKTILVLVSEL